MQRRHRLWSGTVVAIVAIGALAGCTTVGSPDGSDGSRPIASTPSAPAPEAELEKIATELSHGLECTDLVQYQADLSVYDQARGFDCLRHDGRAIIVRAYAHASTVEPVVTEWSPTFGKGRSWTRGEHWVAFGPREQLLPLARDHGGSAATSRMTTVGAEPEAGARDSCMGLVSGAAGEALSDPTRYAKEAEQLDAQFPGTARLVEKRVSPEFRARWKDAPDYEQTAAPSAFGDDFRAVCRDARGQTPDAG